jgi:hypothetical protein
MLKYSYQRLFTRVLRMTKHMRVDGGNGQMSTELLLGCGFPFWVLTLDCYASGRKLFLEVFCSRYPIAQEQLFALAT